LYESAEVEKPKTFASVFINVNLSVFSPVAKDIGSNRQTAPKNTTKSGIQDPSFQKYLHQ
jgi:hypothetical protein